MGFHNEATKLLAAIREEGPKYASTLKTIEHSFSIPNEIMTAYLSDMLKGDEIEILKRIALGHIPIKEKIKKGIEEQYAKDPLLYIIKTDIIDEKGRIIATVNPIDSDLEGHICMESHKQIQLHNIPLCKLLETAIDKGINYNSVSEYLLLSTVIDKENFGFIQKALKSYFDKDYISWLHLIIPQLENIIRNILETNGGRILKPSKSGGYQLRSFDELLRDEIIISALGEDFCFYFRILFTDQRGLNARNQILHGMVNMDFFNRMNSDRIFHSLLCIGLIK